MHPVAEPVVTHPIGGGQQVEQFVVPGPEHGEGLVLGENLARENPIGQVIPPVGAVAATFHVLCACHCSTLVAV